MIFEQPDPASTSVPYDENAPKKGHGKRDRRSQPEEGKEPLSKEPSRESLKNRGNGLRRNGKGKSRRSR